MTNKAQNDRRSKNENNSRDKSQNEHRNDHQNEFRSDNPNESRAHEDMFRTAHLSILISYTIFSLILVAESFLMHWEIWAVVLLLTGVAYCWILHIKNIATPPFRIWLFSILMMCTFFFYGIHETSTFDLAVVMSAVIMLFIMAGMKPLITLCQISYCVTMTYEIIHLVIIGETFDTLVISRIVLHFAMIFMIGRFAKIIIDRWSRVLEQSKDEVDELTDATNRLNDFLANVSHELRTPINAVIGLTGVCIEKEQDAEIKKELVEVQNAGRRVSEQIGDILDYSEIDRNDLAVNYEDFMLSSLLHDLVQELRMVKPKELELVIDVDPAIPAMMNTDVSKLKKIMKALITNGLKYTAEGGVYVRISSEVQSYGVNLRIEISDTGIGMSEEELERINERFYQADSGRTRSAGGLGLGISIVNGFVSALGGFMTISSKKGSGTRVHVSIPMKVIDSESCMSLSNREKLCIGAFLHFEKYANPNVREYYNAMVRNIVTGLGVQMHRVDNPSNLRRLTESTKLTHLFITEEEYLASQDLIEDLAKKMVVAVVASTGFQLPEGSWAKMMERPFYCFPVVTILNMTVHDMRETRKGRMMLRGVKTLVVDDEPMNLTVAMSIFKRYGMVVTTARSGPESIDLCREQNFDIVFMDHMMQGMDGVEAMKLIRAEVRGSGRDFPIVALTANAMSTAKQMFLAEGFDGFVSKPIELEELERVMGKVLPRSKVTYEMPDEIREKENSVGTDRNPNPASHSGVSGPDSNAGALNSPDRISAINGSTGNHGNTSASSTSSGSDNGRIPDGSNVNNGSDSTASGGEVPFHDALAHLGINAGTGLHYCNHDEEFYQSLLLQYAQDMREKLTLLAKYKEEQDYPNYAIHIHSVKSTSKMIGAEGLSEKARALEAAAKEDKGDVIDAGHPEVMDELRKVTGGLLHLLGAGNPDDSDADPTDDDEILEFSSPDDEILEFGSPDGDDDIIELGPFD